MEPLVDLFVAGFNTCLVVTGQSGFGKSFAVAGESNAKAGIFPICLEHLFSQIGEGENGLNSKYCLLSNDHLYINTIHLVLIKVLTVLFPSVVGSFVSHLVLSSINSNASCHVMY